MYDISMDDALSDCWWCSVWWWCSEVFRPFTQSLTHSCMDHHMVTLSLALLNFVALAERKKIGREEANWMQYRPMWWNGTKRTGRSRIVFVSIQYCRYHVRKGSNFDTTYLLNNEVDHHISVWTNERTLSRTLFFPSQHSQPLFSNFKRGPNSHPQLSIHPLGIHFSLDAFASYFLFLPCCSRKPRTRIQTDVERVRQDT